MFYAKTKSFLAFIETSDLFFKPLLVISTASFHFATLLHALATFLSGEGKCCRIKFCDVIRFSSLCQHRRKCRSGKLHFNKFLHLFKRRMELKEIIIFLEQTCHSLFVSFAIVLRQTMFLTNNEALLKM